MVINAAIAVGLAPLLGWFAPAIATTLAAWAMVALLHRGAKTYGRVARFDDRLRARLWRMCAAAAVMGAVLWVASVMLGPFLNMPWLRALALTVLIGIGILSYFGAGSVLGAFKLAEFRSALRRSG